MTHIYIYIYIYIYIPFLIIVLLLLLLLLVTLWRETDRSREKSHRGGTVSRDLVKFTAGSLFVFKTALLLLPVGSVAVSP